MTDARLEGIVGTLLRTGVLLAAAVVLTGGIWLMVASGATAPQYSVFHGEPPEFRSVHALFKALAHPQPRLIVQLGLLLLILTPVARVVLCLVGFAAERDRTYVGITLIVLAVLLYSLTRMH